MENPTSKGALKSSTPFRSGVYLWGYWCWILC